MPNIIKRHQEDFKQVLPSEPESYKRREVPVERHFLDLQGKPQRNLPIFELDELW